MTTESNFNISDSLNIWALNYLAAVEQTKFEDEGAPATVDQLSKSEIEAMAKGVNPGFPLLFPPNISATELSNFLANFENLFNVAAVTAYDPNFIVSEYEGDMASIVSGVLDAWLKQVEETAKQLMEDEKDYYAKGLDLLTKEIQENGATNLNAQEVMLSIEFLRLSQGIFNPDQINEIDPILLTQAASAANVDIAQKVLHSWGDNLEIIKSQIRSEEANQDTGHYQHAPIAEIVTQLSENVEGRPFDERQEIGLILSLMIMTPMGPYVASVTSDASGVGGATPVSASMNVDPLTQAYEEDQRDWAGYVGTLLMTYMQTMAVLPVADDPANDAAAMNEAAKNFARQALEISDDDSPLFTLIFQQGLLLNMSEGDEEKAEDVKETLRVFLLLISLALVMKTGGKKDMDEVMLKGLLNGEATIGGDLEANLQTRIIALLTGMGEGKADNLTLTFLRFLEAKPDLTRLLQPAMTFSDIRNTVPVGTEHHRH